MPVQTVLGLHVVADKHDPLDAELRREIDAVEPGIPAPADLGVFVEEQNFLGSDNADQPHIVLTLRELHVLRHLQPFELGNPFVFIPPQKVAAVENVGPRNELPRIVDRDDTGATLDAREVTILSARP